MKRIAAQYIFPISQAPIRKGLIEIEDDGTILKIESAGTEFRELASMEYYNGILCPNLINPFKHIPAIEIQKNYPRLKQFLPDSDLDLSDCHQFWNWIKISSMQNQVTLGQLLNTFSLYSAHILNLDKEKGSLEPGKNPGITLISHVDLRSLQLRQDSQIKKLLK